MDNELTQESQSANTGSDSRRSSIARGLEALRETGKVELTGSQVAPKVEEKANSKVEVEAPSKAIEVEETEVAPKQEVKTEQQVSPEEAARREEQSWKDKYYEAERRAKEREHELERVAESAKMADFSRQEREIVAKVEAEMQPKVELANRKFAEANRRLNEDGDYQGYQEAMAEYEAMNDLIMSRYQMEAQRIQSLRSQAQFERLNKQEQVLDRQLKELAGVSYEDVLKANPKIDRRNPNFFMIQETALKLQKESFEKQLAEEKRKAEEARREARKEWETRSPASEAGIKSGGGSAGEAKMGIGRGRANIRAGLYGE